MVQIVPRRLRDLTTRYPSSPGRPLHLSAASGLVVTAAALFVVADDDNHLGIFPISGTAPGVLLRLFDDELPAAKPDRKKRKPDLESLLGLPSFGRYPSGALLALGSGSTAARRRGVVLGLDAAGNIDTAPRVLSLAAFFEPLDALFPEVNLEGATIRGDDLLLFQRGHAGRPENFAIRFDLPSVLSGLEKGQLPSLRPNSIVELQLGYIGQVPFSVTDATALPDGRIVVTAVAEDTSSTYADGACLGAVVALLDQELRCVKTWPLDRPHKIEGVHARLIDDRIEALFVTDADDPDAPAMLLQATLR